MVSGTRILDAADSVAPLKEPVALCIFNLGLEEFLHDETPVEYPRVTTRGQYRATDLASTPVSPDNPVVELLGADEHMLKRNRPEEEYDVVDEPRGFDDDPPEEVTVFVHGWMASERDAVGRASMFEHSMRRNDYSHPVFAFTWDASQPPTQWKTTREIADRNGVKLAEFASDYSERNPDTRFNLVSNSIGARPVLSALEQLRELSRHDVVDTVAVMGATVPGRSVSFDGRYGGAIRTSVDELHSYRTEGDRTLNQYYRLMTLQASLGGSGCNGNTPDNLREHHVEDVPDHFSFYVPGRGCIDRVVEDLSSAS